MDDHVPYLARQQQITKNIQFLGGISGFHSGKKSFTRINVAFI